MSACLGSNPLNLCTKLLTKANINAKLLYQWQKAAQQPLPTDPAEAAEVRALRAQVRRQAQELEILKKAIASKCYKRIISHPPTL